MFLFWADWFAGFSAREGASTYTCGSKISDLEGTLAGPVYEPCIRGT
jgi:hypothetical protein